MEETPKTSPLTQPPDRVAASFIKRMLEAAREMGRLIPAAAPGGPGAAPPEALKMWNKANRIYDEYLKYETGRLKRRGFDISCTPGCSWCCRNMPTGILRLEVMAARDHLADAGILPKAIKRCLDASGLWSRLLEQTGDEEAALRSFAKESQCPFLDHKNGLCTIYPVRPLVCRSHFATTPADWCDPTGDSVSKAVRIALEPPKEIEDLLDRIDRRLGPRLPRTIAEAFLVFVLREEGP